LNKLSYPIRIFGLLLVSLFVQTICIALYILILTQIRKIHFDAFDYSIALTLQFLLAILILKLIRLPSPWMTINLFFLLLIHLSIHLLAGETGSSGTVLNYIPVAILIFSIFFIQTFWTGVPYYPTNSKIYEHIQNEIIHWDKNKFHFVDLGCGFGGLLLFLSRKFPQSSFTGYEVSPVAYCIAKLRTWYSANTTVRYENFWKISLEQYSVIYAFLSPIVTQKLEEKLLSVHLDSKTSLFPEKNKTKRHGKQLQNLIKHERLVIVKDFPLSLIPKKITKLDSLKSSLYIYSLK
jgi:hypothetical protein